MEVRGEVRGFPSLWGTVSGLQHPLPMWLEGTRLQQIDTALEGDRPTSIDQVLADILKGARLQQTVPTACPSCRRDLIRHPLPVAGLFVSRCPDGHGAWMDPSVADGLQRFVETHASVAARRRHQIRLLRVVLVIFVLSLTIALLSQHGGRVVVGLVEATEWVQNQRVSETNWPRRGWMYKLFWIPTKAGSLNRHDELAYFVALVRIMDEGITHRINMDGVLRTSRTPAQYERLYEVYRDRQSEVLARLERLDPPPRLREIHGRILVAAVEQIRFYERFMRAKKDNPGLGLSDMLGDPSLQTANRELHAAWDEIRRLYPNLDPFSSGAIELRFCGFDAL